MLQRKMDFGTKSLSFYCFPSCMCELGRGLLERRIPYVAMLWALSPIRDMSKKHPPSLLRPASLGDTEATSWLRYRKSCTEVSKSAVEDEALRAIH